MSQQIDNQIVKMQFDNASFEKNAEQSMSTLDKLKKALKFDKVDMTPIQKAFAETEATATRAGFHIRDVWLKVSEVFEYQIARKIVNLGEKMFNALTLEGVSDGFKEYELKMGSIQTIMAGTGESLATVNKYLEELNTYSDKTIYSFSDMTNNIGKFTNAGVKLKDAVAAIKGIANEAAVSGANASEASRAMYNFSQALSAGYVKLIDWKSIENANMATKEFKQTLIDVAQGVGTVVKVGDDWKTTTTNMQGKVSELFNSTKGFNDSLNHQWMTTEVLNNALEIYATDIRDASVNVEEYERHLREDLHLSDEQIEKYEQLGIKAADAATEIKTFTMLIDTLKEAIGSGWAMSWQYIIGDFEQAKALWTDVGKTVGGVIDEMSEARNNFLREGLRSGWENTIAGGGLKDVIPDAEKFRTVLTDLAREQGILSKDEYVQITDTNTFIKSLHDRKWMTADLLAEAVDDYTNILTSMTDAERDAAGFTKESIDDLSKFNKTLSESNGKAQEFADSMNAFGGRENIIEGIKNVFASLSDVLGPIRQAFIDAFGIMDPGKLFALTERFREFTEQLKVSPEAANTLYESFKIAFGGIKTILDGAITTVKGVSKLILPLLNLFDAVFGLIGKIISAVTGSNGALEAADKFSAIGDKISDKYLWVMQKLADLITRVANAIRGIPQSTVFTKIASGVNKATKAVSNFWDAFVQMPIIQQMMDDFNRTVESIEAKVTPMIDAISSAFDSLGEKTKKAFSWATLNTAITVVYNKVTTFVNLIKNFAERIKLFFVNLKSGKSIVDSFKASFGDIVEKAKELKDNVFKFFEDLFSKSDEIGDKFNLKQIQQAIHDFVANITPDQITMIAVAGAFMLIAINMLRLSDALRNAVEAFTGIGVALKNVINSYIKKQKSTILQVAEAIVIVAAAIWVLSTIPQADLQNAVGAIITLTVCLGALVTVLTLAGLAMAKWGGGQSMVKMASGLAIVAGSLLVAVLAVKALEYVDIKGVIPKLGVLAIVMLGLLGISALMGKLDKFSKGSLTIIALSASLFIAASALAKISDIPADKLEKSMESMFKMMLGLAALTFAASKVGVFSAVGLIAIVLTLDKILPLIENIVNYDYTSIKSGLAQNEEIVKKLGLLVGAMVIIGAIAGNRLKGAGIAMLSIAAVFGALLGIAKLASMMKPHELAQGEEFIMRMTIVIGLLELLSKKSTLGMFGGKNGGEGSKAFTRIAVTMGILLGIAKLASMMSVADILKGEAAVFGLTLLVGAMLTVAQDAEPVKGAVGSIAAMLFAISMVLMEVGILSLIPVEHILPTLGVVLSIIAAIAVLAKAISSGFAVFDKNVFKKVTSTFPLIASLAVVVALALYLQYLAKLPIKNVVASAGSIVAVIFAVSVLAKAIGSIKGDDFSESQTKSVLGALLVTAVIAGVIGGLTWFMEKLNLDPHKMISAAAAISMVLLGITPALYVMSKMNGQSGHYKQMRAAILGAMGLLLVAAVAIGGLSRFGDANTMIKSAVALSIGLVAVCVPLAVLAAMAKFLSGTGGIKKMEAVVGNAISILLMVSGSLIAVSRFGNGDTIIQSATALAIALVAISIPIAVLAAVGQLCSNANIGAMWSSMLAAVVALGAIAGILIWFSNSMDLTTLGTLNDAIPVLVACMAGVSVMAIALATAGDIAAIMPGSIIAGLEALVGAIAAFGLIVAALVGLGAIFKNWANGEAYLERGLDVIVVIFDKIGEAVGALISGFGLGLTRDLDLISKRLIKFSEDMGVFSENIKAVNQEAIDGCKNVAAAMLYLTAAEFLNGLSNLASFFLGTSTNTFSFGTLGSALAEFCDSIKDIPEDAIKKASVCSVIAKRIGEIFSSLDKKGGVVGWFQGEKDEIGFAKSIAAFGKAIKLFSDEVKDIPDNIVELAQRAADAADPLVQLTRSLVSSGGILQKLMGEQDIGDFGKKLYAFGTGLKNFVSILLKIEDEVPNYPELIQRCADATNPMINLARGIQNSGGILAGILGENDLSVFADTLVPFANALRTFVNRLNSMASEVPNFYNLICRSAEAADQLVKLANSLENIGGIGSIFKGDNTLDRFGETLKGFGEGLAGYATTLSGIDLDLVHRANESITELVRLGALASGVTATAFSNLKLAIEDISTIPITGVAGEIAVGTPLLVENVNTMFNELVNTVNGRIDSDRETYEKYGSELVFDIGQGILKNMNKLYKALSSMVTGMTKYLDTVMDSEVFEKYGENLALGLAKGVKDNKEAVIEETEKMAKEMKGVTPEVLEEHSPSKAGYRFGKFYDLGLANGITDYSSVAVSATENMSERVVESANSIISSISRVIDSDMDAEPVIRPVLDTSDIENKAGRIGQMFDSNDLSLAYGISSRMKNGGAEDAKLYSSDNTGTKAVNQYNFTQNNYSPKALSSIDIYRQTKNQISMAKGVVANA